jgi:hypothetical protein
MSSRALRRLREVVQQSSLDLKKDEDLSDSSSDDEEDRSDRIHAFHTGLLMPDSDSDSSSTSSSELSLIGVSNDEDTSTLGGRDEVITITQEKKEKQVPEQHHDKNSKKKVRRKHQQQKDAIDEDWEEDLKGLCGSATNSSSSAVDGAAVLSTSYSTYTNLSMLLQQSINVPHLDLDYVLRQVLGHARPRSSAANKKRFFFGEPKLHWVNIKPPTYIGGGIGMIHSKDDGSTSNKEAEVVRFSFQYSETYHNKQRMQYETQVQPSADVNILAIFVANNPYCVEALYQLALVLYRTGEMEQGNELLRRALYVHECAFHSAFRDAFFSSNNTKKQQPHNQQRSYTMDATCPENAPFFLELFTLMQVASMMGCFPTSLAISQFLLALDPHRDHMGMLCCFLDFFALAACQEEFIVKLVESKLVRRLLY